MKTTGVKADSVESESKSVNERIKMYFGKQYGITLKSTPGRYTIATAVIPAVEESEVAGSV